MFLDIFPQKKWQIQDFPEGGALTPKVGVLTYYFAICCRKLHENERILTLGAHVPAPPWIRQGNVIGSDAYKI